MLSLRTTVLSFVGLMYVRAPASSERDRYRTPSTPTGPIGRLQVTSVPLDAEVRRSDSLQGLAALIYRDSRDDLSNVDCSIDGLAPCDPKVSDECDRLLERGRKIAAEAASLGFATKSTPPRYETPTSGISTLPVEGSPESIAHFPEPQAPRLIRNRGHPDLTQLTGDNLGALGDDLAQSIERSNSPLSPAYQIQMELIHDASYCLSQRQKQYLEASSLELAGEVRSPTSSRSFLEDVVKRDSFVAIGDPGIAATTLVVTVEVAEQYIRSWKRRLPPAPHSREENNNLTLEQLTLLRRWLEERLDVDPFYQIPQPPHEVYDLFESIIRETGETITCSADDIYDFLVDTRIAMIRQQSGIIHRQAKRFNARSRLFKAGSFNS